MTAVRRLTWAATVVAALTSPIVYVWAIHHGHGPVASALFAILFVGLFRGTLDLALRNLIEHPKLSLDATHEDMEGDALMRRRMHFWKGKLRLIGFVLGTITFAWLMRGGSWVGNASWMWTTFSVSAKQYAPMALMMPFYFIFNFLILMGPLMFGGASQIISLEPGDADFGVKLDDVRGQKEAKEEIRKVVTLWQAGDDFVRLGGKRERGMLFLGAPGTGKTMLAKGIATSFNCPILIMPGSGFAQTFIGMDVIIVRWMARRARKAARKWGGQCIIFIDEIDAVGMRRAALGGQARTDSGTVLPQMPGGMMGGMGGGGQAGLQSLLVVMDGIDNPPFLRKTLSNKVNLWLDALYIFPRRVKFFGTKTLQLRLPKAKPTGNQIFFVGATNVPLEALDPALTRAGRLGRHVHFRTPTKRDRLDIFDLYMGKVAHEADLDTEHAREELARVTDGYSPASIEQVCSIALTYAHHSGREAFARADILEAMVTVEAGTALGWGYESDDEERAIAIHEAGHAITSWLYEKGTEAIRLSIRRRGDTGGHLQSVESIERFAHFRDELMGRLVCILGAYAAEVEFFDNNGQGVGGDLRQASMLAGMMVGGWGMEAPHYAEDTRKLEKIGQRLVSVAVGNDVQLPPSKRKAEHIILGAAYVTARHAVFANRTAIEKIVGRLVRDKEIYGDDLEALLNSCSLREPVIDWTTGSIDYDL